MLHAHIRLDFGDNQAADQAGWNDTPGAWNDDSDNEEAGPFQPMDSLHAVPGSYGDMLVAEPVKVKAVPLTFSKKAKRVDVRKLKENLWDEMKDRENPVSLFF